MAAASDDDQPTVPDIDDHRLVVEHQWVGFPVVVSPGVLDRKAWFVAGGAVNFARDQHRIVKKKAGSTLFNDLESGAAQRRAARGRDLERVSTRNTHAAAVPEIGVNQDWQSHLAHASYQAVETGGVIEMAVAADDRFDVAGIQLEPVHVADHAVWTDTCIEEQLVRGLPLRDRQQER